VAVVIEFIVFGRFDADQAHMEHKRTQDTMVLDAHFVPLSPHIYLVTHPSLLYISVL